MALVYVTEYEYQADIKVFAVENSYQADLCFFEVDQDYRADTEAKWFLKTEIIKRPLKYIGLNMSIRQT